jgi:peptidoglycan hydrolase-like protein with peptidoglycan-binding domain
MMGINMRATMSSMLTAARASVTALVFVFFAALAAGPAVAAPEERRVALVIGNGAYTSVPPLANPTRDARAMAAALKRLGFEVVEGYDLSMDAMRTTVRDFATSLDGAKAGLVFYAGHGIAVGDENYLLPVDAALKSEADLDFRAVNVHLILRQMQRDERVNIVILDACRDNPFTSQLASRSRSVYRGLSAIETQSASGILIAFATDPRSVALDGERDGNSPFTAALLKHIETSEVSITTVMDRVRADVWESTGRKQKPWTNSSIIGEFRMNPSIKISSVDPAIAIPPPTLPAAPVGLDRSQLDIKMWEAADRGNSTADFRAYLDAFPNGQFATFARNRLARLQEPAAPPASAPSAPSAASAPVTVAAVAAAAVGAGAGAATIAARVASPDEALKGEVGSAQTEAAMKLNARARRELQTRLRASGFKPGPLSANFGASQRKAVREWQVSRGIPATGFFTAMQATALNVQSEPAYRRLLAAEQPAPKAAPVRRQREAVEPAPTRRAVRARAIERDDAYEYGAQPAYRGRVRDRSLPDDGGAGAAAVGQIIGGAIFGGITGIRRR